MNCTVTSVRPTRVKAGEQQCGKGDGAVSRTDRGGNLKLGGLLRQTEPDVEGLLDGLLLGGRRLVDVDPIDASESLARSPDTGLRPPPSTT